jgi:hypothetical protein
MEFKIQGEERRPVYHINPERHPVRVKKAALPLLFGILTLLGIVSSANPLEIEKTTLGEPVYNPQIYKVTEMAKIADGIILDNLAVKMQHNVPLKLKSADGKVIEFIADGYNADKKLAYEWVAAPGYSKNKNDKAILSTNEIAMIKNTQFGDTMILVLDMKDYIGIRDYTSICTSVLMEKDEMK